MHSYWWLDRHPHSERMLCACWFDGCVTPRAVFPSIVGKRGVWRSVDASVGVFALSPLYLTVSVRCQGVAGEEFF